jgi:hypothetical protein
MAEPTSKSAGIEEALEALGFERAGSIKSDRCVFDPTHDATTFRDELSRKEYTISGMCQDCQDSMFGTDEDGPGDDHDTFFSSIGGEDDLDYEDRFNPSGDGSGYYDGEDF